MKKSMFGFLCIVLMLVLLPMAVSAEPLQQVDTVEISGFELPQVGAYAQLIEESDSLSVNVREPYELVLSSTRWKDENGFEIFSNQSYKFEAGMTYCINWSVKLKDKTKYEFADDVKVVLKGIDPAKYSTTILFNEKGVLGFEVKTTTEGTFEKKPIQTIDIFGPEVIEGSKVSDGVLMSYNHCASINSLWENAAPGGTFEGGTKVRLINSIRSQSGFAFAAPENINVTYNLKPCNYTVEYWDGKDPMLRVYIDFDVPEMNKVNMCRIVGLDSVPIDGTNAKVFKEDEFTIPYPESARMAVSDFSETWFNSDGKAMTDNDVFEVGETYYFEVTVQITDADSYQFTSAVNSVLYGYEEDQFEVELLNWDNRTASFRYYLKATLPPDEPIAAIVLSDIDAPLPDTILDFGARNEAPHYQIKEVRWYNDTDHLYIGNASYKYEAGKSYTVEVDLVAEEGFAFVDQNQLTASINGQKAHIIKREEKACTVQLTYPNCQKGKVTQVFVWGLEAPEAGKPADYTATVNSNCYLNKNDHAYFENGIGWYDLTDSCYLELGASFIPGHEYQAELYISPQVGYEFANPTLAVNGLDADDLFVKADQIIAYQKFPVPGVAGTYYINKVSVTDVDVPVPGNVADFTAIMGDSAYGLRKMTNENVINGMTWYDETAQRALTQTDVFESGHVYRLTCHLDSASVYLFSSDAIATLNGESKGVVLTVSTDGSGAILQYTFAPCSADAKVVNSIDVVSLDVPSAGKLPDYFITCKGEGYSNKNWNTQYMHNGIVWHDITEGKDITPDDAFKAGHAYKVSITLVPTGGYAFADLASIGGTINGNKAQVSESNGEMILAYSFSKLPVTQKENPFTDVSKEMYYYDPVLWAVENGITNGISATLFGPDEPCTRGQVVTFLWRSAGKPAASGSNPFIDVKKDMYYYDAVLWAVSKGITNGTSATTFEPDAKCTRGQIVTFLWRFYGEPAVGGTNPFTDVPSDQYYYNAVLWAVEKGITTGTTATTFEPNATCTRGQIVTFLYRSQTK